MTFVCRLSIVVVPGTWCSAYRCPSAPATGRLRLSGNLMPVIAEASTIMIGGVVLFRTFAASRNVGAVEPCGGRGCGGPRSRKSTVSQPGKNVQ